MDSAGIRTCTNTCVEGFVDGSECRGECQSGAFVDVSGEVVHRKCVERGLCSHYALESVQVGEGTVVYAHCFDACPDALPVRSQGSAECKTCESVSAGQKTYWRGSGDSESACVASCVSGLYERVGESKNCVSQCDADQFVGPTGEDRLRKCVYECPGRVFVETSKNGITHRTCTEIGSCERFVVENVTIAGKDTPEEYTHCYED